MIDAWFKFGKGQFVAEVDGLTATLDIPGGRKFVFSLRKKNNKLL